MTIIHVQFSDAKEDVVIASFSCHQDDSLYTNQGQIQSDDPRYIAFVDQLRLSGAKIQD